MKILLVADSESVHTARWVRQLADTDWDVRVFPSRDHGIIHPELQRSPVYHTLGGHCAPLKLKPGWKSGRIFTAVRGGLGMRLFPALWPQRRVRQLLRILDKFQPDVVHALEFQAAGYLALAAKQTAPQGFPPWIVSNWGSDIYWFRRFPEHERKIRDVLAQCDYYACECRRDVCLAEGMGLKGVVLPVIPNAGGVDLERIKQLRQPGPVHQRRVIMLKGYQHWVGRALIGLAALESCAELLKGYEVVIHSVSPATAQAARAFQKRTGVPVMLLPNGLPHDSILERYGRARIALGLSLSDGVSTSFLEALAMGAFPIQSWTACADEWIEDGISGLMVPPEEVAAVAKAVRRVLTDDVLVDVAAELNAVTTRERLDQRCIREQAINYYRTVARDKDITCN